MEPDAAAHSKRRSIGKYIGSSNTMEDPRLCSHQQDGALANTPKGEG